MERGAGLGVIVSDAQFSISGTASWIFWTLVEHEVEKQVHWGKKDKSEYGVRSALQTPEIACRVSSSQSYRGS